MANEPIPAVEIRIEQQMLSRATWAARLEDEKEMSLDLRRARNLLACVFVRLPRIQEFEPRLAAQAADSGTQRSFVDRALQRHNEASQM